MKYEVDDRHMIVQVGDRALMHMTLLTLESYSVRYRPAGAKKSKSQLETFALLWGNEIDMADGRRLVVIQEVTADINAERDQRYVIPNKDSLDLKVDTVSAFWPEHRILGDFHSHPYRDVQEVKSAQGWNFSPGDFGHVEENDDFLKYDMSISLVMAICAMQKAGSKAPQYMNGNRTLEFTLGNYRLWLTAYAARTVWKTVKGEYEPKAKLIWPRTADEDAPLPAYIDEIEDIDVELSVPRITGFEQYTEFGRHVGPGRHQPAYQG